jgi:hypothetical protein
VCVCVCVCVSTKTCVSTRYDETHARSQIVGSVLVNCCCNHAHPVSVFRIMLSKCMQLEQDIKDDVAEG